MLTHEIQSIDKYLKEKNEAKRHQSREESDVILERLAFIESKQRMKHLAPTAMQMAFENARRRK